VIVLDQLHADAGFPQALFSKGLEKEPSIVEKDFRLQKEQPFELSVPDLQADPLLWQPHPGRSFPRGSYARASVPPLRKIHIPLKLARP
jgi:hypothetical protein